MVGAPARRIADRVYRFRNVSDNKAVPAWCEKREVDCAFLPEIRLFSGLKLLAMDMDSTLITIECIDELGDLAGKKNAVASITAQAMRGEIDYRESLRRRVRLLRGLGESALERVYAERLRLTPGAEALVAACRKNQVKLLLVSGGFTFFTGRLKDRLGLDFTLSNTLEMANGSLTGELVGDIVDANAKALVFTQVASALGAGKHQTLAIGDGANDLKMMAEAGLSVAFRAKPVVRAQASCALNWSGLDAVLNFYE